jgi:flavin-dependent dehydrogenase
LLARQGFQVAVFEQEKFPRFHVGESLLPANLPIFERLGCHQALHQIGLIEKPGATVYDEYEERGSITFSFPRLPFQPASAYQVVRAPFDEFLLQHAADSGARVYRQHTVEHARHDPEQVIVWVTSSHGETHEVRARVLIDASGRHTFLGKNFGKREPLPDLGKVALFAHFRNVQRETTIPEGDARLYLVPQGWLWWFSFADGTDSIGCVLHSQVVKARPSSIKALFDGVLATSPHVTAGLVHAQRVTPVHPVANFSYRIMPCVGDRYLAIGDAAGFIDPIFSTGVFLAMRSAELAVDAVVQAFRVHDFRARRFRRYAKQLRQGMAPFVPFIRQFYDPAFLDILFSRRPPFRLDQPVVWVLSGAAFDHRPLWLRLGLALFFCTVYIRKAVRWATGLPVASRRSW